MNTVDRMVARARRIDNDAAVRLALAARAGTVAAAPVEEPRYVLADRHTVAALKAGVDGQSAALVGAYAAAVERQPAPTPAAPVEVPPSAPATKTTASASTIPTPRPGETSHEFLTRLPKEIVASTFRLHEAMAPFHKSGPITVKVPD